jgi:site-specific recombinase XerD
MSMTIEDALEGYLEAQQRAKRRPKTIEWHQTALGLFGQYLRIEGQCDLLAKITERHVHGWLESLRMPTARSPVRSDGTIASYARSVRAWCHWLVKAGYLKRTPFAAIPFPRVEPPVMHPLETKEWERLLAACSSPGESSTLTQWGPARNRALLWVLYDTGMRLSEVCALCLGDVDLEQGMLMVRRNGFKGRWLPLGHDALHAVRVYLDQHRLSGGSLDGEQRGVSDKPLFLLETGNGLTENGIMLLFGRLRRRAGLTREEIGPTLVRDSFAVRYLQAGGDLFTLRDRLGQMESAAVTRYLRKSKKKAGEYET